jgi:hypothetical protein
MPDVTRWKDVEGTVLATLCVVIVIGLLLADPLKNLVTQYRLRRVNLQVTAAGADETTLRSEIECSLRDSGFVVKEGGWPQVRVVVSGCRAGVGGTFGLVEMSVLTNAENAPAYWTGARGVNSCEAGAIRSAVRDMTLAFEADRGLASAAVPTNPRSLRSTRATR